MEYSRRDTDDRFEQISRNLMRWVLGPGLLSMHVGAYLITLVALLLWNFARTPSDIWVDDPLRRWGLLVVFHATAVGAGLAAWRVMRVGETSAPPTPSARAPRTSLAPVARVEQDGAVPRTEGVASPSEEWARRWLRDSVRIVRDAVVPGAVTNGHDSNGHAPRPSASDVAGPEITEWGVLFARRAREMMSSARDHLPLPPRPTNGATPAESPVDPTDTWPGGTEASRPVPQNGTWPATANGVVHAGESSHGSERSNGTVPHYQTEVPPPLTTARAVTESEEDIPVTSTVSEDARWTWVEAAASAWLARREMDDPPADPVETSPLADDPTATP